MADDMLLVWFFVLGMGLYLLIGLLVASKRMSRGTYSDSNASILQFILEVFLWPAANVIDPPR